jgi:hypothetical protein
MLPVSPDCPFWVCLFAFLCCGATRDLAKKTKQKQKQKQPKKKEEEKNIRFPILMSAL